MAINKMSINIDICDQCLNPTQKGDYIYRAFDSTICSKDCYVELYNLIIKHDPQFIHPRAWKCSTDLEKLGTYTNITSRQIIKPRPLKKIVSMDEICIQTNGTDSPISITTNNLSMNNYSINKCIEVINNISFNILPYIQNGTSYVQERVNTMLVVWSS